MSLLSYEHSIEFECRQFPSFLYTRLQTGRIMVWWCPSVRASVRVSVRPSVRPSVRHSFPHFSPTCFEIILKLKFCVSLYFDPRKIKFECLQLPSIFAGVISYAPFVLHTLTDMQFSAHFSYMLWHIELKFCIWLCFTLLQIKFECRKFCQFLLELRPFAVLGYICWSYVPFATENT